MAMIHVNRGATSLGVFSEEEVRDGLHTGRFVLTDLGWREGMANWQPLAGFSELGPRPVESSGPSPPPLPSPLLTHESSSAAPTGTSPVHGAPVIGIARNFLLPQGRIGRAQFIVRTTLIWIGSVVLDGVILIPLSFGMRSERPVTTGVVVGAMFGLLAALLCLWLVSMQAAKRLHDFNRSGGWIFIGLIMAAWASRLTRATGIGRPSDAVLALASLFGVLGFGLILSLTPGNQGGNRFGLSPTTSKGTRVAAAVCACLVALIVLLLLLAFISGFVSGIKSATH